MIAAMAARSLVKTRDLYVDEKLNLLVIRDGAIAAKYVGNWRAHQKHSTLYRGK